MLNRGVKKEWLIRSVDFVFCCYSPFKKCFFLYLYIANVLDNTDLESRKVRFWFFKICCASEKIVPQVHMNTTDTLDTHTLSPLYSLRPRPWPPCAHHRRSCAVVRRRTHAHRLLPCLPSPEMVSKHSMTTCTRLPVPTYRPPLLRGIKCWLKFKFKFDLKSQFDMCGEIKQFLIIFMWIMIWILHVIHMVCKNCAIVRVIGSFSRGNAKFYTIAIKYYSHGRGGGGFIARGCPNRGYVCEATNNHWVHP